MILFFFFDKIPHNIFFCFELVPERLKNIFCNSQVFWFHGIFHLFLCLSIASCDKNDTGNYLYSLFLSMLFFVPEYAWQYGNMAIYGNLTCLTNQTKRHALCL